MRQFIFYFDANQEGDIDLLSQICDKLLHYAGDRNGSNGKFHTICFAAPKI
jgi:hypothetical protein